MLVTDDLRAIAERADRELDAVHDFFEHSKIVWRSFQTLVAEGHKVSAENLATGTRIDQDGLVRLAPQYSREYLATFTFRHFVSAFEAFLFNFLHRLLLHNPWQLSEKQLAFSAVLQAANRDEILSGVILKQLNDLKYEQLRDWFIAINKAVKLDCPTEDEIDALAEIKATRDILEHNEGVVNDIYRRKAGKKARYQPGDHLEIDDAYHLESWRLMKKIVRDLTTAAVGRLTKQPFDYWLVFLRTHSGGPKAPQHPPKIMAVSSWEMAADELDNEFSRPSCASPFPESSMGRNFPGISLAAVVAIGRSKESSRFRCRALAI